LSHWAIKGCRPDFLNIATLHSQVPLIEHILAHFGLGFLVCQNSFHARTNEMNLAHSMGAGLTTSFSAEDGVRRRMRLHFGVSDEIMSQIILDRKNQSILTLDVVCTGPPRA